MQKFAKIGNIAQKIAKKLENAQASAKFATKIGKLRRNLQKTEKCAGIRKICTNNRKIAQEFPQIGKKHSDSQNLQTISTIAQEIAKNEKNCAGIREICKKSETYREFAKFAQITEKLRRNLQKIRKMRSNSQNLQTIRNIAQGIAKMRKIAQKFAKFAKKSENYTGICKICQKSEKLRRN